MGGGISAGLCGCNLLLLWQTAAQSALRLPHWSFHPHLPLLWGILVVWKSTIVVYGSKKKIKQQRAAAYCVITWPWRRGWSSSQVVFCVSGAMPESARADIIGFSQWTILTWEYIRLQRLALSAICAWRTMTVSRMLALLLFEFFVDGWTKLTQVNSSIYLTFASDHTVRKNKSLIVIKHFYWFWNLTVSFM